MYLTPCSYLLLILCVCNINGKSINMLDIPLRAFLDITLSVHSNYHQGCITFIYLKYAGLYNLTRWSNMVKYFTNLGLFTSSVSTEQLASRPQSFMCGYMPALFVVRWSNTGIRQFLEELPPRAIQDQVWLLFLPEEEHYKNFFSRVNLTFSTRFMVAQKHDESVILMEVFKVTANSEVHKTTYGRWTPNSEIQISDLTFSERRTRLYGYNFKAVSVYDPPLAVFDPRALNFSRMDGFLGHVWSILEEKLHFKTSFVTRPNLGWGSLEDGKWSGMMEMLVNEEVDVAVSDFTMTTDRLSVVDYTVPILYQNLKIYVRSLSTADDTRWQGFLLPFSSQLWEVVCLCIFSIAACLFVLNRLYLASGMLKDMLSETCSLHEALFVTCRVFFNQGHNVKIDILSWRITFIFIYLTSYVILAAYSASLISSLAKQPIFMPFKNLEGLLNDGTYQFRVLQKSSAFETFKRSQDRTLRRIFYRHLFRNIEDLPQNSVAAVNKLCSSRKYAVQLYSDIVSGLRNRIPCDIVALPGETFSASVSMVTKKGNPYLPIINYYLSKLKACGIMQRLRVADWPPQPVISEATWTSVGMIKVTPVLLVLVLGMILSVLLLFTEKLFHRYKSRVDSNRRMPYWSKKYSNPADHS